MWVQQLLKRTKTETYYLIYILNTWLLEEPIDVDLLEFGKL